MTASITTWWPALQPATRDWLREHSHEALPRAVAVEILEAGGVLLTDDRTGVVRLRWIDRLYLAQGDPATLTPA